MFDSIEDDIAEHKAEVNVIRRQIAEMDARISTVMQDEKAVRERLQASNTAISESLDEIYQEMKRTIPASSLPSTEYEEIQQQSREFEKNLERVEGMILEHIKKVRCCCCCWQFVSLTWAAEKAGH